MTRITVENCSVRVRRRGGWSWGADAHGLVDRILREVPRLIAAAVEKGQLEGDHLYIDEPLKVTIPCELAELIALKAPRDDELGAGLAASQLEKRALDAINQAITTSESIRVLDDATFQATYVTSTTKQSAPQGFPGNELQIGSREAAPILWSSQLERLLWALQQTAILPAVLRAADPGLVYSWHLTLLGAPSSLSVPLPEKHEHQREQEHPPQPIKSSFQHFGAGADKLPEQVEQLMRLRLTMAFALAASRRLPPTSRAILDEVERWAPFGLDSGGTRSASGSGRLKRAPEKGDQPTPSKDDQPTRSHSPPSTSPSNGLSLPAPSWSTIAGADGTAISSTATIRDEIDAAFDVAEPQDFAAKLVQRARSGDLLNFLRSASSSALEIWHQALVGVREASLTESEVHPGSVTELQQEVRRLLHNLGTPPPQPSRAELLRTRLLLTAHIALQGREPFRSQAMALILDIEIPLHGVPAHRAGDQQGVPAHQSSGRPGGDRTSAPPPLSINDTIDVDGVENKAGEPRAFPPQPPSTIALPPFSLLGQHSTEELHMCTALPFLVLGSLHRMGWMNILTAVWGAADRLEALPYIAAGLAYKVLRPPERGWRRDPESSRAARIFAGFVEDLDEGVLTELGQRTGPSMLAPLDALLRAVLTSGHDSNQALFLHAFDPGGPYLVADTEGLFPIALVDDPAALGPLVAECGGSTLLIPLASARPQLLDRLDSQGLIFITDAPPTRHQKLRELRGHPDERRWTNGPTDRDPQLRRTARTLEDINKRHRSTLEALFDERRSVPLVGDSDLELSLTMAASVALADIAWTLYHEREPTDPWLTLERFSNLDAWVRRDQDRVRVRIPLGRRHRHLLENGLLAPIPNVPWLGGLRVEILGA